MQCRYRTTSIMFEVTFTPFSAVFGGACEKYILLIRKMCERHQGWLDTLSHSLSCYWYCNKQYRVYRLSSYWRGVKWHVSSCQRYSSKCHWCHVCNRKVKRYLCKMECHGQILMSCLDVEPAVNAALMHAAKDPRDGSYGTYSDIQLANIRNSDQSGYHR